jgi:hypothetical protein
VCPAEQGFDLSREPLMRELDRGADRAHEVDRQVQPELGRDLAPHVLAHPRAISLAEEVGLADHEHGRDSRLVEEPQQLEILAPEAARGVQEHEPE